MYTILNLHKNVWGDTSVWQHRFFSNSLFFSLRLFISLSNRFDEFFHPEYRGTPFLKILCYVTQCCISTPPSINYGYRADSSQIQSLRHDFFIYIYCSEKEERILGNKLFFWICCWQLCVTWDWPMFTEMSMGAEFLFYVREQNFGGIYSLFLLD